MSVCLCLSQSLSVCLSVSAFFSRFSSFFFSLSLFGMGGGLSVSVFGGGEMHYRSLFCLNFSSFFSVNSFGCSLFSIGSQYGKRLPSDVPIKSPDNLALNQTTDQTHEVLFRYASVISGHVFLITECIVLVKTLRRD